MKVKTIIGIIIVMFLSSCVQRTTRKDTNEIAANRTAEFKSGLTIKNGINRGTGYRDSLGVDYNVRYIPITITNDSTLPIKLDINFLKKYTNPLASSDNDFKIMPMAREWAVDGGEITDNMFVDLKEDIDNPRTNKILKPGEKLLIAIGTRYYRESGFASPLPEVLFVQGDSDSFQFCENMLFGERTKSNLELGLKLIFNRGKKDEHCAIIPCGQISYIEN
jgi:hypothetical protein